VPGSLEPAELVAGAGWTVRRTKLLRALSVGWCPQPEGWGLVSVGTQLPGETMQGEETQRNTAAASHSGPRASSGRRTGPG